MNQEPKQEMKIPTVDNLPREEEKMSLPTTTHDPEIYMLMDQRDELQIIATLEGRYVEEFVYSFQQGGREITGLSWMGIQEASREYGGISTEILELRETEDEITIIVRATDKKTGSSRLGMKTQSRMKKASQGGAYEDSFFRESCLSKAQRNAIRQLLPQTLLKQWIEKYRDAKKKPAQPATERPSSVPRSPAETTSAKKPTQAPIKQNQPATEDMWNT